MFAPSAIVALALLACCPRALALDPSLQIRQYAHSAWKVRDGFFKGSVYAVTQTPDGYLWLGTEFGLVRFDGVRGVPWQPPADKTFVAGRIVKLLTARDGTLWIGAETGLASLKDGTLTQYPELAQQRVSSLLEDRQGTVWAGSIGTPQGKLCAIRNGLTQCYDEQAAVEGGVAGFYEDRQGALWVSVPSGLWKWAPGPPKFYRLPDDQGGVRPVGEDDDGSLLITRSRRVERFIEGRIEPSPMQQDLLDDYVWPLLRDRDGGLWVPTLHHGLVHARRGRPDVFDESDGLSADTVRDMFEDREGNVWVATIGGLDRFRDVTVPTFTIKQGLLNPLVWSILASTDGSLWLGTPLGLGRWRDGQTLRFGGRDGMLDGVGPHSLFEDHRGRIWVSTSREFGYLNNDRFVPIRGVPAGTVPGITEDTAGEIWLIAVEHGLIRIHDEAVDDIPWASLGRDDFASAVVADPRDGGIWLGFIRGDIAYVSGGQLRATYSAKEGLAAGRVISLRLDAQGALWVATEGGLSRLKDGSIATLSGKNGLPCDTVQWSIEDDDHALWLYTACGLVRIPGSEIDAWIAATERDKNTKAGVKVDVFDISDGVRSNLVFHGLTPRVAKTSDGKLWFLPADGLSFVDPGRLRRNELPPPVHVEQIVADGNTFDAAPDLRLPPHVRDLVIDYTALSFVAPEKVRFRYKLEGQDPDWKEVVNHRQVQYSNLPPGPYRFRVQACNNSGVWNEAGDSLNFSIAPAFYQRTSFRLLCVVAFVALLFAVYRMRVDQLARQFNRTLEARVSERTRIARDLHDTLLQSYQGLLLRFQSASKLLPDRPVEAKTRLDNAIDQAAAAITEGRDAVQGLRSSAFETNDLANAVTAMAQELTSAAASGDSPLIEVEVEGISRNLNPVVRDEAYRIATEALRNAFRHAQAKRIVVEIAYEKRQFRLRVRDDGKGIEEATIRQQATGHFGLPGMRERAEIVGGRLDVWSAPGSGTHVELIIPGSVAYRASRGAAATTARV